MTSKATDLPSGPLDSPVSDIHIAKIAQDFIRNWEKLAPYLQLLPAHEDVIKKNGRYGHQKREALRMWKEQNGNKATYRALIVIAKQVSNVELAENIEALVAPHPPHRENGPSRAVDLKMIQHYEGSARAPAAHAPGHCKHNEDTIPTKDVVLPPTSHAPSKDPIPVQESLLPSIMQSDAATPLLPVDTPASPTKLSPSKPLRNTSEVEERMGEPESNNGKSKEIDEAEEEIKQLEKTFDDIIICAQDDMMQNKVEVRHLRHSIVRLPRHLKCEHQFFVQKVRKKLEKAKTIEAIFLIVDDYWDFLNYSILEHIIDRHASDDVKTKMAEYVEQIKSFRRGTRLKVFSQVYKRKPRNVDEKLRKLISTQKVNWSTATLEDAERFRNDFCSELSLFDFSLELAVVTQGCVEITWLVPESLVAYIQKSVKLSSPTMRNHHISHLTIDGFVVYDSAIAMQNEHKVTRLQRQAINVNYSFLLDEVAPDELVPHLVARKLLTPEEAREMTGVRRQQKITTILETLPDVVGMLPTFCAALLDTGQPKVAERLMKKFRFLLEGESPSIPHNEDDIMISGEVSAQPSPPPPDSCLVTAEVEGPTLTQARYTRIASLMSSLLCLLTQALVYVGHTLHPLTLHWHCSAEERGEGDLRYSIGILSAMAQEGIIQINDGKQLDSVIPQRNEMRLFECAWDGDVEGVRQAMDTGAQVDIQRPDGWTALMYASQNGHVEVVDTFLQHGASVELPNNDGNTALMCASLQGHVEVVDTLIQHGANADSQMKNGWTALMYASQNGHVEVVDTLLQHGASVDLRNEDGWTALMCASQHGHVKMADTFLHHGASVELPNNDGWTALMYASWNGHVEVVETFLQHGASVDWKEKDGFTALMIASWNGHAEVVHALLQHGASVDLQKEDGFTALMIASHYGHVEVMDTLLQHGARVDLQKKDGFTALMIASQNGHAEVVDTLLQHGASVDLQKKNGWTALMSASCHGHGEVVDILLQHGAIVDWRKEDGVTALMIASQNGHVVVLDTLLKHGASVDLKKEANATALMMAIYQGLSGVVEALLQAKPDVNITATGYSGNTALTLSCQREDLTTVCDLLKLGANPNVCTQEGQTPLLLAVRKRNIAMAREVLGAGADPNHIQEGGLSALMLCCEEGNSEMAELLLNSQADPNLQQSGTGFTALMFASKGDHFVTVCTLLQHGANTAIRNRDGITAADVASINEHPDVCATLELKAPQTEDQSQGLEYPDNRPMEEAIEQLITRFHKLIDYSPTITLGDSEKRMVMPVPSMQHTSHKALWSEQSSGKDLAGVYGISEEAVATELYLKYSR